MTTIFFRTLVIYVILIGAMRLMGKRQIGELEISELVTTLLVSEIASLPIENTEIPILYAVVPIVTLLFMEITASALLMKIPFMKHLFSSRPTVLVRSGKPLPKELRRVRITIEELISSLRQKDVSDISEVDYAILEANGQISVLKKQLYQPPTAELLHMSPTERGITHILISDGKIDKHNLKKIPNGNAVLHRAIKTEKCRVKDVLLMLCDDCGKITVIQKKDTLATRKGASS